MESKVNSNSKTAYSNFVAKLNLSIKKIEDCSIATVAVTKVASVGVITIMYLVN